VWGPGLFLIAHRFPWYIGFRRLDIWRSILLNNVALACVIGLLSAWVGLLTVVQIYLPVVFLAAAFGTWMFHIQHNFQSTYWEWDSEWDYLSSAMKGASYYKLPRVLQWFTGNIGYHHIHHLSSKVPNYELQRAYRENPVFHVRPLSFWAAFREGGLALWDEQGKQLVSFRQARAKQERRLAKPPLFTEQTGF
jgi:omega-6 fatty acid desaturase (delta-12 desaturase)